MLFVMLKGSDIYTPAFDVRLYVSDLSYEKEFYDRWYELMPQRRRERADRFKNGIDAHRCIAAYALLAGAVCDLAKDIDLGLHKETLAKIGSGSLDICEEDKGKPFFKDIPLCFNISHAGERVIVALSPADVGCDVERRSKNAMSVAKRFFADAEYRFLAGIDDEDELSHRFTRIWTQKESVVKCSGEGISRPFDGFCVIDEQGNAAGTISLPDKECDYHIREFEGEMGYCYSICSLYDHMETGIRRIKMHLPVHGCGGISYK